MKNRIVSWLGATLAISTLILVTALSSILIPLHLLGIKVPEIRFSRLVVYVKVLGVVCLLILIPTLGPPIVLLVVLIWVAYKIVWWLLRGLIWGVRKTAKPFGGWGRWLQAHARGTARSVALGANLVAVSVVGFFITGTATGKGPLVEWVLAAIGVILPTLGGLMILWVDCSVNWAFAHAELADVDDINYSAVWDEISHDIVKVSLLYVGGGLGGMLSAAALLVYSIFRSDPTGGAIIYAVVGFIADGITFSVNAKLYAKTITPQELRLQELRERTPGFWKNVWRAVKLIMSICLMGAALLSLVTIVMSVLGDLGSSFPEASLVMRYRVTIGLPLLAATDNWIIYLVNFVSRRRKWPRNFFDWAAWAGAAQFSFAYGLVANVVAYFIASGAMALFILHYPAANATVQALVLSLSRLLIRQWVAPAWTAYAAQEGKQRNYGAGFKVWRKVMSHVK